MRLLQLDCCILGCGQLGLQGLKILLLLLLHLEEHAAALSLLLCKRGGVCLDVGCKGCCEGLQLFGAPVAFKIIIVRAMHCACERETSDAKQMLLAIVFMLDGTAATIEQRHLREPKEKKRWIKLYADWSVDAAASSCILDMVAAWELCCVDEWVGEMCVGRWRST